MMNQNTREIIGFCGGLLSSIQSIPQIHKTYRCRSARDLSYLSLTISAIGGLLTFYYGISIDEPPVYLPIGISLTSDVCLAILKYRYDHPRTDYDSAIFPLELPLLVL